jgi:hypothetical protein
VKVLRKNGIGDGLRLDQAGAADDDDVYSLPSFVDDWMQVRKMPGAQRLCIVQTREETNTEASLAERAARRVVHDVEHLEH